MIIESGESSLTLFGSLVRLGVEKLPESGQPLTSDAIHEAIHYDNPILDQFLVEPDSAYSGSYLDMVPVDSRWDNTSKMRKRILNYND